MMKDSEKEPFWWDPSGFEMNFVENMAELRQQRGMSQSELAKRASDAGLQFHQPTIQRIESGERPIRLAEAVELARILGSTVLAMMHNPTGSGVRRNIIDLLADVRSLEVTRGHITGEERRLDLAARNMNDFLKDLSEAGPEPGDSEIRRAATAFLSIAAQLRKTYSAAAKELDETFARHDGDWLLRDGVDPSARHTLTKGTREEADE